MPWDLTGNSGTNPDTNFLGTQDSQPLVIGTNNSEKVRVIPDGQMGIGTTNPTSLLHIKTAKAESRARLVIENRLGHQWFANTWTNIDQFSIGRVGKSDDLVINANGNVGIGTTEPQEQLHVDGNVLVTGDITLSGADCAENFDVEEAQSLEPGMVMVIDQEGTLKPSEQPYDKRVAGVVSGAGGLKPGIVLDKQESNEGRLPVALVGKVVCNVDARHSPIEVGDLLTTSSTPGHAMKAADPFKAFGAVLGKALRPLKGGQGLIPVLVALQ